MKNAFLVLFTMAVTVVVMACSSTNKETSGASALSTLDAPSIEQSAEVDSVQADSVAMQEMNDSKDKIVVLDFFATWCGPCKAMAPTMEKMEKKYAGKVEFRKVNVDQEPELAAQYNIRGVPTIVVLSPGGEILDSMVGAQTEDELDKMFTALL